MGADREPHLRLEYRTTKPFELLDLTASLMAVGEQYKRFVTEAGFDVTEENIRLYIKEIRPGSIIAELISQAQQASMILDHLEVLAGFATNINDIATWLMGLDKTGRGVSKRDLQQFGQIFDPVANDSGAQIFINVSQGGKAKVDVNYGHSEANIIQNQIRRLVGGKTGSQKFQKEVLYLRQARDDTKSRSGDRGVIEKFSDRSKKLIFSNEDAKKAVLDHPENIFRLAFVVDGEVSTIEGEPVSYKIDVVHESFDRDLVA